MKSKILVIDDEENICFSFKIILTEQGYDVATTDNYETALDLISETEPDLVISDIIFGRKTGLNLLNEVKKRKLHCPVILITGKPEIETSTEAVRLGAFDYIPKPIRKNALLRVVRLALAQKKLLDEKEELEKVNTKVLRNMEAIFRSIKDGVITVDNNLNIIEVNEAAKAICGLTRKKTIGASFNDLPANCNGYCKKIFEETLSSKKTTEVKRLECRHSSRPYQVVQLSCSPLMGHGEISPGAVLVIRDITKLASLENQLEERAGYHCIVGKSKKMQNIYSLIDNLLDTDTTVLITGETGTGKELVANAIHFNSLRKDHPFIKINCSALSENLLESELFGHVKGAFTGAIANKKGRFEIVDKGTILLDEIGDLSPLIQLKLLRVIQEGEFERVGDSTPIKTDVRLLAATNCDLKKKIKQGEFREDLYYRIKVVEIPVPALQKRREDIFPLAEHFLDMFNLRFKKRITGFSNEVNNALMNYPWPGNIRELEHTIEHGFVLCKGKTMLFDHLPVDLKVWMKNKSNIPVETVSVNREKIIQALNKTDWNKAKAARILGIGRRTLYRQIEKFKITSSLM